jgi:hypothetical protein
MGWRISHPTSAHEEAAKRVAEQKRRVLPPASFRGDSELETIRIIPEILDWYKRSEEIEIIKKKRHF